jgi:hypothetical protein
LVEDDLQFQGQRTQPLGKTAAGVRGAVDLLRR